MKITITGNRSEGKSMLALIIHKLLLKHTPYTIRLRETPNESREFKSLLKAKEMKKLQHRDVNIEVINN